MPTPTRRATTGTPGATDADDRTGSGENAVEQTAEKAAGKAQAAAQETTARAAQTGSAASGAVRQIVTAPVAVARVVADDVVATVRRPDAVLYVGGLVGLAVVGVLEWPVAAVAGVGLAIANGMRRTAA